MKIIGMTGGVGAGKSTVLAYLKEKYQAHVILADEVGHRLMQIGGSTYQAMLAEYGERILLEDGTINKAKLAQIAFATEQNRLHLNAITHPLIKQDICEEIAFVKRENKTELVILEAAILVEGGLQAVCDEIWFVQVEKEVRIKRLMASRDYSRQKAEAIIASQPSDEEYLAQTSRVIHNSTSLEEMQREVDEAMRTVLPF